MGLRVLAVVTWGLKASAIASRMLGLGILIAGCRAVIFVSVDCLVAKEQRNRF
jgi:hypothetical protein